MSGAPPLHSQPDQKIETPKSSDYGCTMMLEQAGMMVKELHCDLLCYIMCRSIK